MTLTIPNEWDPEEDDCDDLWHIDVVEYEERFVDIRFKNLFCEDCGTHREHKIHKDACDREVVTECRSCHTIDISPMEDNRDG